LDTAWWVCGDFFSEPDGAQAEDVIEMRLLDLGRVSGGGEQGFSDLVEVGEGEEQSKPRGVLGQATVTDGGVPHNRLMMRNARTP
jgi:hypothetical protein